MVIEKGIPIPPIRKHFGPRNGVTSVTRQMQVGDSILVESLTSAKMASKVLNGLGGKATHARQVDGAFRVWRVS